MGHHLRAKAIRVLSRPSSIDYNQPCIIKHTIAHWPAIREFKWHPRRLQAAYGDRLFEWGLGVHSSETLLTTLNRFFQRKHPRTRRRCYVFDSTFDADCPELLDDYSVPAIFQFGDQDTPTCQPGPHAHHSNRWMLIGHAGSGSQLHADPLSTSAWNALVFGSKEWVVIQPDLTEDQTRLTHHPHLAHARRCSGDAFRKRMRDVAASVHVHRWFSKHVPQLWRHAQCVAASDVDVGTHCNVTPNMIMSYNSKAKWILLDDNVFA
jgi:hypothetical protein